MSIEDHKDDINCWYEYAKWVSYILINIDLPSTHIPRFILLSLVPAHLTQLRELVQKRLINRIFLNLIN